MVFVGIYIIKTINDKYYCFGDNKEGKCLVNTSPNNNIILPPKLISFEYLKKKIGSDKPILDIKVETGETFILQQI